MQTGKFINHFCLSSKQLILSLNGGMKKLMDFIHFSPTNRFEGLKASVKPVSTIGEITIAFNMFQRFFAKLHPHDKSQDSMKTLSFQRHDGTRF